MSGIMDCAMFEGNKTTSKVRKYHFPSEFLCFIIFLVFFMLRSLEKSKIAYITTRRKWVLLGSKLVRSSGTYLCSMQGSICRIRTLGGDVSSKYGIIKLQNIYERLYLVRIETSSGYMAYKTEAGSWHKAQHVKRTHEMQLQLDINGSPCGRWPT